MARGCKQACIRGLDYWGIPHVVYNKVYHLLFMFIDVIILTPILFSENKEHHECLKIPQCRYKYRYETLFRLRNVWIIHVATET